MLDRVSLSTRNGWMDGGRVFIYFTIEDVKQSINVGKNKAVRVMSEMEALGLIMRKKRGQGQRKSIWNHEKGWKYSEKYDKIRA